MSGLTRNELMTLEDYAQRRVDFRQQVMAHKMPRQVWLGDHVHLLFEDRLTIQYQIQEMLRAERIFEAAGIEEELETYNPLIPDGDNWKATMMIEYADVEERKVALSRLKGIEHRVWVRIGDGAKSFAIADEDLERENDQKTSSVHFLRFQLTSEEVRLARSGADIAFGVDHDACQVSVDPVAMTTRLSLVADLAS